MNHIAVHHYPITSHQDVPDYLHIQPHGQVFVRQLTSAVGYVLMFGDSHTVPRPHCNTDYITHDRENDASGSRY